ncbi:peptidase [Nitrosopumilus sp. K4]|uniref:peptidase n=1 Tax=Nitrosopumilus sp. K4 TaxID=2795383 RepID=UPI001BA6F3D1|nr:peptidase [Nitrosopumilus sp. K4]
MFIFAVVLASLTIENSYGHGVGSETFPPVKLDGKLVTLEVSSSTNNPNEIDDQQISISMIDFDSKVTLRDVTFQIKSERGEQFLFEKEFKADNGFLVFNFVSEDTEKIIIEEENAGGLFGSMLGLESRKINVKGPNLSEGGLYKFDISILTADSYSNKLDEPLVFNAGISIAQTTKHTINDPNFGEQTIHVITFYDEISNFNYNSNSKEITFSMPFEWTESNVNQTSVVHEELIIPKAFGDLLVSGFSMYVNDIKLSDNIVTIDDFFSDGRVVHFIINQKELWKIFEKYENQNGMDFVIKPSKEKTQLSSVTENGQFRILVSWEPETLKSNSDAKIIFDVTDIFLKNTPIAVNYDLTITQDQKTIYQQSGMSSDSRDNHNIAEFTIPKDVTGILHLNFENLAGNDLARTSIPIVIDPVISKNELSIPEWIRSNAAWWAEGQIDDATFIQGIEYLIRNGIILIPSTPQSDSETKEIPSWIRSNAAWWAEGQIDDETFVQGLQYLIQKGILRV